MKFNKAESSEYYYERLVSEDGTIEIGIYPVMFGYRVRAGFIGGFSTELDWCGGDNQTQVELLYSIAKSILESQGNFNGMPPFSKIKPFFKDEEFIDKVYSLLKKQLEPIILEPLSTYREQMFKNL